VTFVNLAPAVQCIFPIGALFHRVSAESNVAWQSCVWQRCSHYSISDLMYSLCS